jgi:RNA-binding protein
MTRTTADLVHTTESSHLDTLFSENEERTPAVQPTRAPQKIWPLTSAQRSELKARAHHMPPAVMIGQQGITDNILKAIEKYFTTVDLIKTRVLSADHDERNIIAEAICTAAHCQLVQHIGRQLVFFRSLPKKKKKIEVPGASKARKPSTKNAYFANAPRSETATRPKPKASFTHKHRTTRFSSN